MEFYIGEEEYDEYYSKQHQEWLKRKKNEQKSQTYEEPELDFTPLEEYDNGYFEYMEEKEKEAQRLIEEAIFADLLFPNP